MRIGLIGVGNVGSGFAGKLLEKGYPLTVFDRDPTRLERAVTAGAAKAGSAAEVAQAADTVLLSLPGSPAVEAVMEGPAGLLGALRPGQLIIDTGTTHPDTDIHYAGQCRQRGAALVDAPITGRRPGWIIMVGGERADYERAEPVLAALAYKVAHVGPVGRGQVLKLANQMVLAGQWAIWAEAITFLRQEGMEARLLGDLLEFGIPDSIYGDDYAAGGQLALHCKDLGYALDVAGKNGAATPVTALAHEAFKAARNLGDPNWQQAGVIAYWRALSSRG